MSRIYMGIILSALVLSCDTTLNMKPPSKSYFLKYFGDEGNQKAVDLIVNKDGSFYILGNSQAPDSVQKIYLAHADAQGQLIKQTTYGSPDKIDLDAKDFLLTTDGKLAVVANKKGSYSQVVLLRFGTDLSSPPSQNDIVNLQLESAPSANVYANSITQISDGGFIVMGFTDYVNGAPLELYDALHFRTSSSLVQFTSQNGWKDINGDQGLNNFMATNKGIEAFPNPGDNSDFIYMGTKNGTNQNRYTFWSFSLKYGGYPTDKTSLNLTSNEILTSALKTTDAGYLMSGMAIAPDNSVNLKLARCFTDILKFDASDFALTNSSFPLGNYTTSTSNLALADDLFVTACNSATGNGAFIVLSNIFNPQSRDIWLMKFDSHNLLQLWASPVVIGGDGDDSAAAVAELTDGKMAVLATMSVGSANGGVSVNQNKIALFKLNAQGKLAD